MKERQSRLRLRPSWLWRKELLIVVGLFFTMSLMALFIVRTPDQAAPVELATAESATSLQHIYENPINAPYKLLTFIATSIAPSIVMVRIVSLFYLLLTSIALYFTLRHWHTEKAAGLATLGFATNSVVLTAGRLGTPLIATFSWFILIAILLWLIYGKSNKIVPTLTLLGVAAVLYTPGAIWFFLILLTVGYWGRSRNLFQNVRQSTTFLGGFFAVLIAAPLLIGLVRNPESIKGWLLLPDAFDWASIPRSILRVPSAYIYRMPTEPLLVIKRLPVFDLASGFLFLIGLNAYRRNIRLDRTRVMIGVGVIATIIGALGQTIVAVFLIMPFAFSMIAAGIEFLLDLWRDVFPRNPFAKSFGLLLVTVVMLFSVYYQLTRFTVVWPRTPETRDTYNSSLNIE